MVYKSFQGSDISHICYPITRRIVVSQIQQMQNPSEYIIRGLQRYIYNNNTFSQYYDQEETILSSIQNGYFPKNMCSIKDGRIFLNSSTVKTIIFIKGVTSLDTQKLTSIMYDSQPLLVQNGIIFQNTNIIGFFIPDINAILLLNEGYHEDKWNITMQYNFEIHEFEFLCNIQPGEFNETLNVTAYTKSQTDQNWYRRSSFKNTYISSIGLYDDNNTLMAIAKVSSPIKVSQIIDTTILVGFDYIT